MEKATMSDEQDVRAVIEGIGRTFSALDVDRWLSLDFGALPWTSAT